ncbi:hypothetical protein MZM54_04985 [[Brevibacterium] frigoritolerans]|nr:hypothetical protein [Peribacillus frigoritolerans]
MKEEVLSKLQDELHMNLAWKKEKGQNKGYICNQDSKKLYSISPQEKLLTFEGRWMGKRERWSYIKAGYQSTKDSEIHLSPSQLRDYLHHSPERKTEYDPDINNANLEMNDLFLHIQRNYDCGLINTLFESTNFLHILHPESTFEINWTVDREYWHLSFYPYSYINDTVIMNKKIKRGQLVASIDQSIQDYINIRTLNNIFGDRDTFKVRFPLLDSYFRNKLNIYENDQESLASYIEEMIGISPFDLEMELANSRKSNKLKSINFSIYKLGGEGAYSYILREKRYQWLQDTVYFALR